MDDNQTTVIPPSADEVAAPLAQMTGEEVASEATQIAKTNLEEVTELPMPIAESAPEELPIEMPEAEVLTEVAEEAPIEMPAVPVDEPESVADETAAAWTPEEMPTETPEAAEPVEEMPGMEAEPAAETVEPAEVESTDTTQSL